MFTSMQEHFKPLNLKQMSQGIDLSFINVINCSMLLFIYQKRSKLMCLMNVPLAKMIFECEYIRAREYDKSRLSLKYSNEKFIQTFSKIQDLMICLLMTC